MKKIDVSKYNELFNIAENILQKSWQDLGLPVDEIVSRSNNNSQLVDLSKKHGINPTYWLYKQNANAVVDQILKALNVQVEEKKT